MILEINTKKHKLKSKSSINSLLFACKTASFILLQTLKYNLKIKLNFFNHC